MHPVITRFLDLDAAADSLSRRGRGAPTDDAEAALWRAADALPALANAVLAARGKAQVPPTTQQQLIVLATRAATSRLMDDPALGPRAAAAIAALEAHGAPREEAEQLVAQAVLEEAFGFSEDPDHFDADFVAETLDALPHLGALTQELVDEWLEAFVKAGPSAERPLRTRVAETLLEAAWGEGPQPVNPEHLDDALDHLGDALSPGERPRALAALRELLDFLAGKRVLGPQRLERLSSILASAATSGELADDEAEDEEDADEA
jgi:hypothetical protein